MKLYLVTYESIVAYNAGYAQSATCVQFIETLTKLVDEFLIATGANKKDIYWEHVTHSDWCKNMVIIWAKVPSDWKPTDETFVLDEIYNKDWRPELAFTLGDWISGNGKSINCVTNPPKHAHNLFKAIQK
jgi:hypothetical protein